MLCHRRRPLRRARFALALALLSGNAAAEWTDMARSDNVIIYIDKATIAKNGNMMKVWVLRDYKSAQKLKGDGKQYLSSKSHEEFDCIDRQSRSYSDSWYSTQMASGGLNNLVAWWDARSKNEGPSEWFPLFFTNYTNIWNFLCNTK